MRWVLVAYPSNAEVIGAVQVLIEPMAAGVELVVPESELRDARIPLVRLHDPVVLSGNQGSSLEYYGVGGEHHLPVVMGCMQSGGRTRGNRMQSEADPRSSEAIRRVPHLLLIAVVQVRVVGVGAQDGARGHVALGGERAPWPPLRRRAPRLLLRLATTGDAKVLDGWLVLQMLLVLVLLVLLILLHVVLVVLRLLLLLGIEPHLAVYDRRRRGIVQDHLRSLRRLLVRRLKASSLRVLMLLLEQLLVRRRRCGKQHSTHLAVAHDLRPGLMLAEQAKEVALAPHVVLDRRLRVFSKLAGVHSPARIADGDLILRTEHLRALELMLQPALPHWGAHGRDGLAGCLSRAQ